MREAQAHQTDEVRAPTQRITDEEELEDYMYRTRKEFEDSIRRQ